MGTSLKKTIPFVSTLLVLFAAGGALAGNGNIVTVNATILTNNICLFKAKSSTLNFGILDPANPVNVTVTSDIIFSCKGNTPTASYLMTDDDGLYETGPGANRMRHTTVLTEFLPYTLTMAPTSGTIPKNVDQTLTLTGTINGADYQGAYLGNYEDTIIISIVP